MFMFATLSVYVGSGIFVLIFNLIFSFNFELTPKGPLWYFMVEQRDVCAQDWWKNLLYINNFYSSSKYLKIVFISRFLY